MSYLHLHDSAALARLLKHDRRNIEDIWRRRGTATAYDRDAHARVIADCAKRCLEAQDGEHAEEALQNLRDAARDWRG